MARWPDYEGETDTKPVVPFSAEEIEQREAWARLRAERRRQEEACEEAYIGIGHARGLSTCPPTPQAADANLVVATGRAMGKTTAMRAAVEANQKRLDLLLGFSDTELLAELHRRLKAVR